MNGTHVAPPSDTMHFSVGCRSKTPLATSFVAASCMW